MISAFGVTFEIRFKDIGEKEDFKDEKHDKQFYQDHQPYLLPPARHRTEPCSIETIHYPEKIHGCERLKS